MKGINKVILIGNLGKDPELRRTPSGKSVVSFPLATTERWTDKDGNQKTEWHNIVAWGKLAEIADQYLSKGRSAYIEGRIQTRSWDDKDGNKRYKTEIVAGEIQFLGGSGKDSGESYTEKQNNDDFQAVSESGESAVEEDDLPF